MSFLNQLKSQAVALQSQESQFQTNLAANTLQTELAGKTIWHYLNELSKHLNVLSPQGPEFALDKKAVWPAMKLTDFRLDSRKKLLRDQEVLESISMGWQIIPVVGLPKPAITDVDFVPEMERVEKSLQDGSIKYERKDILQPDKKPRRIIRFEYVTQARGYLTVTPDHDNAQLAFRLANSMGFGVKKVVLPAAKMQSDLLDELAKLIVAQPNRFLLAQP